MVTFWEQLGGYLDYIARYLALKTGRTLVISVLVCLLIWGLRWLLSRIGWIRNSSQYLYLRMYMWLLLLAVPFMGMTKVTESSLFVRKWLYVSLYNAAVNTPVTYRLYFSGMAVMAVWLIVKNVRLRRKIRKMELCPEYDLGRRIKVRRTSMSVTAFTTGFFRYTIVLPECILDGCDEEEVRHVIGHEYTHIARGHLIFLRMIDWLRILWFVNPLIHICAGMIREDMELICDKETIRTYGQEPERYGLLLIKTLQLIRSENMGGTTGKATMGFASEKAFRDMKRRVRMIADYRESCKKQMRIIHWGTLLVLLSVFVVIKSISYGSHTDYDDYDLYVVDGADMQVVFQDNPKFNDALEQGETGLLIDNKKVKEMLTEEGYDPVGNYWISFGGYMKLPGVGAGGDAVNYFPADEPDGLAEIPYNQQGRLTRVMNWIVRYI